MSSATLPLDSAEPPMPSRRSLLLAAAGGLVAGCGGGSSPPEANLPLLPRPPVVPVDGPAWTGFGGNAQHTALGQIATQQMRGFYWYHAGRPESAVRQRRVDHALRLAAGHAAQHGVGAGEGGAFGDLPRLRPGRRDR